MVAFRAEVSRHQAPVPGDLLLDVQVVGFHVGILEIRIDDGRGQPTSLRIRYQRGVGGTARRIGGRSTERDRASKGWISGEWRNQVCNRLVCQNREARAHDGATGSKWIKSEADARLEVHVVLVVRRAKRRQERLSTRDDQIGETVQSFRRSLVPVVTESQFQCQPRRNLPAVLSKEPQLTCGNATRQVARRNRKSQRLTSGKIADAVERHATSVTIEIVVVEAAELTPEFEGVLAANVAQSVCNNCRGVAAALRETARTSQVDLRAANRELRKAGVEVVAVQDAESHGVAGIVG